MDKEGHWNRTLEHLHEKYADGGYLHLLIPGSPNEAPLKQLRGIIKDEPRLRTIFESVYTEESDLSKRKSLLCAAQDYYLYLLQLLIEVKAIP